MNEVAVEVRASTSILDRREELAREVTEALYAQDPTLIQRYGDAGRAKCRQDMHYTLEHLAPAVALDDPSMFVSYVRWLESMLAARNVGSADVRRSLEVIHRLLAARLHPDEAACALRSLEAGLTSLSDAPAR